MMGGVLADLGERDVIRRVAQVIGSAGGRLDVGDDCAVIEIDGRSLLLSTDVINEGTHIPEGATPAQIGWFLAAINLSDIAAMGGRPLGLLTALSLPRDIGIDFVEGLVRGLHNCLSRFDAELLGGDTKESDAISLAGTAIGVKEGRVLPRKGAKVGDVVAVTGTLGRGGLGLTLCREEATRERGIDMMMSVHPRVAEGMTLSHIEGVHCCMDISDGLSESIYQLSEINGVSFELNYDDIPRDQALRELGIGVGAERDMLLGAGGDYELLLTIDPPYFKEARAGLEGSGCPLRAIGRVTGDPENNLITDEQITTLERKGYEHFKGIT